MLCKLSDAKIQPITAVEIDNRINELAVNSIIDEMHKLFPNTDIKPVIFKYYKQTNATKDKAKHFDNVMKPLISKVHYDATTKNPPVDVMQELGMYAERFKNRDNNTSIRYRPFGQIDKSGIAALYKEYNLVDNLLPLTASCVAPIYNTEPCKKCWWCKEKHWAFGRYDFE